MAEEEIPVYKLAKVGSGAALGRKKKDRKSGLPVWLGGGASSAPGAAGVAAEAGGAGSSGVVTGSEAVQRLLTLGESYGGGAASGGGMGAIFGSKIATVLLAATIGAAAWGVGGLISPNLPLPGSSGGGKLFPKEVAYTGNVSNLPNDASVANSQGFGGSPAPVSGAAFTASAPSGAGGGASGGRGGAGGTSAAVANGPSVIAIPNLPSGSSGGNSGTLSGNFGGDNNGAVGNDNQAGGGHSHALSAFAGGATGQQTSVGKMGLGGIGQDALGQLGNTARYSQDALSPGMAEKDATTAGAPFDNGTALPTTVAGGAHLGGAGSGSAGNTGPGSMNPGMAPGGIMTGNGGVPAGQTNPSSTTGKPAPKAVQNPYQKWINIAMYMMMGAMAAMTAASILRRFPTPWTQVPAMVLSGLAVADGLALVGMGIWLMTKGQALMGGAIAAIGAVIAATAFFTGFGGMFAAKAGVEAAAGEAEAAAGEGAATGASESTALATTEASAAADTSAGAAAGAGSGAAAAGSAGATGSSVGVGGMAGLGSGAQFNAQNMVVNLIHPW